MGTVILAPFSLAWPTALYAIAKRDDAARIFAVVFRYYGLVLLFLTFGFSLASTAILFLLFPSPYHAAASIVPVVALSIMFYGVFDMFCIGIGIRRNTWYAVLLTGLAATTNVVCNLALIPRYGAMGAALATLIACVVLAGIAYIVNQRIYPIPFEIEKLGVALLVGVAMYLGAGVVARHDRYVRETIYLAALGLYGIFLLFLSNPADWVGKLLGKRDEGIPYGGNT